MNYEIPAYLSLPLVGLICPVTVGRLIGVRATLADRRVNTALVFAALCCILRDGHIQSTLIRCSGQRVSAALLDQLSDHAVVLATVAVFLLAYGWVNHSEPRYLAPVVYVGTTVYVILA
ncbi:MAG: hypothetical protein JOZ49_23805, partial [Mycolicibacterium sp.]|nr:hypothetical protein [Mycolicibacterium sp.]